MSILQSNFPHAPEPDDLRRLREENARLKAMLSQHGIAWEDSTSTPSPISPQPAHAPRSAADKIALFRNLFRGRNDIYPQRWESAKGRSGYSPKCGNEWRRGVCQKPRLKCGDCSQRLLLPLTDQVIYDHLAGVHTIGVYPLLSDDTCYFLAADFDDASWQEDAKAFMQSCQELDIPAYLEISRSGKGAHVWIFFAEAVSAREARRLGAALISHTCDRTRQLSLSSYDRIFPNQDTLPKGGFGNLIALPLQKVPRNSGHSVFVDDNFIPFADQWALLASIRPLSSADLEGFILKACGGRHPLDVAYTSEEEEVLPWQRPRRGACHIAGPLPKSLMLVIANQIYISKSELPQQLVNRLIRLAAFQNPEFYKAQAMRLPVWNKPRVIGCAENYPKHIGLPRGCLDSLLDLLQSNNIQVVLQDERLQGEKISVKFLGALRTEQKLAVRAILRHDIGILCAPTAFGKTVTAAALIARRKVRTLVLVHRTELLRQWFERLTGFLDVSKGAIGFIGGGKKKAAGYIDVVVMQSLMRKENLGSLLDSYGQIIVDECHHVSAFSFESILKQAKSKYIVGLTATPIRRDGQDPIIFMQCGPARYTVTRSESTPSRLEVWPRYLAGPEIPSGIPIQEVFRILVNNSTRNSIIAEDVLNAYKEGRKILILTERTEHLALLSEHLTAFVDKLYVLHGRLSRVQRNAIFSELESLNDSTPRVLLATGRLIGEGFDHPPLDTMMLAMPISWRGTLQQYAGRLHRSHAEKQDVRIYDYVEDSVPQLSRMWTKRQRGYQAMGYRFKDERSLI
uniref:DNA/RNA helicase, superfamily II n=1 Tax=Desulfovibrio sp. U5L TaxID=596152 RepID=I2Q4F5_9BACT